MSQDPNPPPQPPPAQAPSPRLTHAAARGADAIIGVSLFGPDAPLDFGRFEQAFVTMFRLTTDGQWPVAIAQYDEGGRVNWKCAAFMMSYVVCVNWVVLQARATPPATPTARRYTACHERAAPRAAARAAARRRAAACRSMSQRVPQRDGAYQSPSSSYPSDSAHRFEFYVELAAGLDY